MCKIEERKTKPKDFFSFILSFRKTSMTINLIQTSTEKKISLGKPGIFIH